MESGHRMRCSMSPSDIPCRSLATNRAVGYSLEHGDTIRMRQLLSASRHGRVHDRRSASLYADHEGGVAETGGRQHAIRATGARSQTGGAGGFL